MRIKASDFRIFFADGARSVVVTRRFNASVANLIRAHLEPALVKQWLSPPIGRWRLATLTPVSAALSARAGAWTMAR